MVFMEAVDFSRRNILATPEDFETLLNAEQKSVACDGRGVYWEEAWIISVIRRIVKKVFGDFFRWEARKHVNWAKGTVHVLDYVEQKRIELGKEGQLRPLLRAAKAVKNVLKKDVTPAAKVELQNLRVRMLSLKYRLGSYEKKGNVDPSLIEFCRRFAENWKETQVVFKVKELSQKELQQIEGLSRYPKFAQLMKDDEGLRESFFRWAILEKNNVDAFVQYYNTVSKLIDVDLSGRIATYGGADLRIEELDIEGKRYKDLTLPFEGKRHSLLNERHVVTFSHDYQLSIGEIFKIFKDRLTEVGNLEYFGQDQGICNWNPNEWGAWNPTKDIIGGYERVDMQDPNWIKKVKFSEIITEGEAKNRFDDEHWNKIDFGPDDYVFSVIAKNHHEHVNITGAHTMLGIAVPLGDGTRGIVYVSKFTWDFPDPAIKAKEYARAAFDARPGALQLPDENACFQVGRDQESVSVRATPEQAQIVFNRIKKDREKIYTGRFFFRLLDDNCIDWVFKTIRHLIPEDRKNQICSMPLHEARPSGLIGRLMAIWRKLPSPIGAGLFNSVILLMRPKAINILSKDGRVKRVGFDIRKAPWNASRPHPGMLIIKKRKNRSLKSP